MPNPEIQVPNLTHGELRGNQNLLKQTIRIRAFDYTDYNTAIGNHGGFLLGLGFEPVLHNMLMPNGLFIDETTVENWVTVWNPAAPRPLTPVNFNDILTDGGIYICTFGAGPRENDYLVEIIEDCNFRCLEQIIGFYLGVTSYGQPKNARGLIFEKNNQKTFIFEMKFFKNQNDKKRIYIQRKNNRRSPKDEPE